MLNALAKVHVTNQGQEMFSYFRGWKRKAGLVTLVFACLFSTFWLRSLMIWDSINVPAAEGSADEVASFDGAIVWFHYPSLGNQIFRVDSEPIGQRQSKEWQSGRWPQTIDSKYPYGGIYTASVPYLGPKLGYKTTVSISAIQYWAIVIPLNAVSAWLLLSNRREPTKPEPSQEPAA